MIGELKARMSKKERKKTSPPNLNKHPILKQAQEEEADVEEVKLHKKSLSNRTTKAKKDKTTSQPAETDQWINQRLKISLPKLSRTHLRFETNQKLEMQALKKKLLKLSTLLPQNLKLRINLMKAIGALLLIKAKNKQKSPQLRKEDLVEAIGTIELRTMTLLTLEVDKESKSNYIII
jgi:hypothetical protein